MECTFCKKIFKNEYILKNHIATSKKCLVLQEELGIVGNKITFPCTFCKKDFTSKRRLNNHLVLCKHKIKSEANDDVKKIKKEFEKNKHSMEEAMEDKMDQISSDFRTHKEEVEYELRLAKEEIKELKRQLHDKTPPRVKKIINNKNNIETNIEQNIEQQNIEQQNIKQNITIYQVMSPEHVAEFFKSHYSVETLLGGQKAFARFVNDGFLKEAEVPVYTCGDRSRQKFYIVKDGKKIEDTDCDSILELTSPGMPAVKKVYSEALFSDLPEDVTEDDIQDNYRDIVSLSEDRSEFKSELSKIVSDESAPKGNFKRILQQMKDDMLPNESKRQPVQPVQYAEPIRRPDVLGVSPGKLMLYRQRYQYDGTIKGPPSIMKQIEESDEARKEYMAYLRG